MVTTIPTMMPAMIFQELVLISLKQVRDQLAMLQIGPLSIGNQFLVMEEKSKTPEKDSVKVKFQDQIPLLLDQDKASTALILLSHNFIKVIKQPLNAHLIMLMVVLTLFHH